MCSGTALLCSSCSPSPWLLPEYWLAQLTFVLIYAIVGLGLMLLAGFHRAVLARPCGLPRRRRLHAGGAAATWACRSRSRSPRPAGLSAAVGVVVGLPALRVKGIYLGIATLAFGFIVEEGLARWESVTGGNAGLLVSRRRRSVGWQVGSGDAVLFPVPGGRRAVARWRS